MRQEKDAATRALVAEDVELRGPNEELFRTAVFRVRGGAITSYETLRTRLARADRACERAYGFGPW